MPNTNGNIEKIITQLDDYSAFLGLIGIILSIQSSFIGRRETEKSQQFSDKVITVSVFIAACASFIDLGTAKMTYDYIMENKEKATKLQIKAAEDLLTSRVFSVIAAIYLVKATLESSGGLVTGVSTPTSVGAI